MIILTLIVSGLFIISLLMMILSMIMYWDSLDFWWVVTIVLLIISGVLWIATTIPIGSFE